MPRPKFNSETAKEAQKKSAAQRKKNNERRAILRELLYSELTKPASKGSDDMLALYYVKKALQGIVNNPTLEDIERMQRILGENFLKIEIEETNPAAKLAEIIKKSRGDD